MTLPSIHFYIYLYWTLLVQDTSIKTYSFLLLNSYYWEVFNNHYERHELNIASLPESLTNYYFYIYITKKLWKGFAQRRKTREDRLNEMMFIGMTPPPMPTNPKAIPQALSVKTEGARRITQEMHEQEYQQALVTIKDKIRENEGPDLKETMQDQIRQWFIECRWVKIQQLV